MRTKAKGERLKAKSELLPCPFCGSAVTVRGRVRSANGFPSVWVSCESARCPVAAVVSCSVGYEAGTVADARAEVIRRWNRRENGQKSCPGGSPEANSGGSGRKRGPRNCALRRNAVDGTKPRAVSRRKTGPFPGEIQPGGAKP